MKRHPRACRLTGAVAFRFHTFQQLAAKLAKTGSLKRGMYYPPDRKIDGTFVRA